MKKIVTLILIIVVVILLALGIFYYIDMNRMKDDKEVLFSTWGYKYAPYVNEVNDQDSENKLTLEIIKNMVAEKGDKLTWSDFSKYASSEIGFGLYILSYEIDKDYTLLIGGTPDKEPMYIKIVSKKDEEQTIDIRYNNIDEFIEKTK